MKVPVSCPTTVSGGIVHVPSPEGPSVIHTLGFNADHNESRRSTWAWCIKKMGSNPAKGMSIIPHERVTKMTYLLLKDLTFARFHQHRRGYCRGYLEETISLLFAVKTNVNTFKTIASTPSIVGRMVTERRPCMNSSQKVVRLGLELRTGTSQRPAMNVRIHAIHLSMQ